MFSAAGAVGAQVEPWFWLWVCGPEQATEESAVPRKRSSREEPSTQPAAGLPHSAGTQTTGVSADSARELLLLYAR